MTNTAYISSSSGVLRRQAWIVLLPQPDPYHSGLAGSRKYASSRWLAPGMVLTYTVEVHNSWCTPAPITVTDPVPVELNYISGTISHGGGYDPASRTITWSLPNISHRRDVRLTFAVEPAVQVISPTLITNTATIQSGNFSLQRSARTLLVPQAPQVDTIPPVVHSVKIDEVDVLTSPTVTLHISATDNIGVQWMNVVEWSLSPSPRPHWHMVHGGRWVPFQADYTYTLRSTSGTHFVGVWVADAARNKSHFGRSSMDFASLILPDTSIAKYGLTPYLVSYAAGEAVNAVLTPSQGDVDLYVWYPGNFGRPNQASANDGTVTETISFTTPTAGTYIFLVVGASDAVYNLSITPGGGDIDLGDAPLENYSPEDFAPSDFTAEPYLSISGMDPLEDIVDVTGPFVLYLPSLTR